MIKRRELIVALAVTVVLTACGRDEKAQTGQETTPLTAEEVQQEGREAGAAAAIYLAQKKQEYEKSVEAKLDEFTDRIGELKAKANKLGANSKAKYKEAMKELNERAEAAREKLEEIKSASAETWEKLKSGMDAAIDDLKKSYDETVSDLT